MAIGVSELCKLVGAEFIAVLKVVDGYEDSFAGAVIIDDEIFLGDMVLAYD